MSNEENVTVTVLNAVTKERLATIKLNGYNIAAGGPLGYEGAMRSFKIVDGDLWAEWSQQTHLLVRAENGQETTIRVAAMPLEENSTGFVEFM